MLTLLRNLAVADHNNTITIDNGIQAVGNGKTSGVLQFAP